MKLSILKNIQMRDGQTMLITVLVLSGVMMSATVIGSYLMLNQMRQATFSANSAQAIAAADAGIECELYNIFQTPIPPVDCSTLFDISAAKVPVTVKTVVTVLATSTQIDSTGGAGVGTGKTYRAFRVTIE